MLLPLLMIGLPVILALDQPDLGTALLFMATGGGLLFLAGVSWIYFIGAITAVIAILPHIWEKLHDYQFARKAIHHVFCSNCGVRAYSQGTDAKGNKSFAVRVNCLDNVDPQELIDAPVKYFNMLHDDFKSPPVLTEHL